MEYTEKGKRALLQQLLQKKADRATAASASFAQEGLWLLNQLAPDSATYNVPCFRRVHGRLKVEALRATFSEIFRRHDVLRTVFRMRNQKLFQIVLPADSLEIQIFDLGNVIVSERVYAVERLLALEVSRPFDLSNGPLCRVILVRITDTEHFLLLNMHHIICDGWSFGVLFCELAVLYPAFCAGSVSPLPDLPLQYVDFAIWQRHWLKGDALKW